MSRPVAVAVEHPGPWVSHRVEARSARRCRGSIQRIRRRTRSGGGDVRVHHRSRSARGMERPCAVGRGRRRRAGRRRKARPGRRRQRRRRSRPGPAIHRAPTVARPGGARPCAGSGHDGGPPSSTRHRGWPARRRPATAGSPPAAPPSTIRPASSTGSTRNPPSRSWRPSRSLPSAARRTPNAPTAATSAGAASPSWSAGASMLIKHSIRPAPPLLAVEDNPRPRRHR
jgi:hypothetical protein